MLLLPFLMRRGLDLHVDLILALVLEARTFLGMVQSDR